MKKCLYLPKNLICFAWTCVQSLNDKKYTNFYYVCSEEWYSFAECDNFPIFVFSKKKCNAAKKNDISSQSMIICLVLFTRRKSAKKIENKQLFKNNDISSQSVIIFPVLCTQQKSVQKIENKPVYKLRG